MALIFSWFRILLPISRWLGGLLYIFCLQKCPKLITKVTSFMSESLLARILWCKKVDFQRLISYRTGYSRNLKSYLYVLGKKGLKLIAACSNGDFGPFWKALISKNLEKLPNMRKIWSNDLTFYFVIQLRSASVAELF